MAALHSILDVFLLAGWLILDLIETPFNAFASRVDPDQAALIRAA